MVSCLFHNNINATINLIKKFIILIVIILVYYSDKMCDQISDAVLDAHLRQDPNAKVACGMYLLSFIMCNGIVDT